MSRKVKRNDFRAPDRRTERPAAAEPGAVRRDEPERQPGPRSWWPPIAAACIVAALVLIIVLANLDSPPPLTQP